MKRFILAIICAGAGSFFAWPFLAQEQPGKLARLIEDGKRAAAFEMIRSGADVNEAQLDGTRPVHWAVYRVDYELMAELIAKKAKVDVPNEFGYTPLAEAAKQGDARMVKMLMDGGSGAEGPNADGQTALMTAIKNGDLAVFQMLIDAGAKVNVVEKVQEQTPLMWASAATRNAPEMVRTLIAKGANVNARITDVTSRTARMGRSSTLPEQGGQSALFGAVQWAWPRVVQYLIDHGAEVAIVDDRRVSPLDAALGRAGSSDNRPSPEVAKILQTAIGQ